VKPRSRQSGDEEVLDALTSDRAEAVGGLTISELAETTGRHRSHVSRIVNDLIELGLADRDPVTRRLTLSWKLYAQAARIGEERLRRRSGAHLRRLAAATGESAYAVVRIGTDALTISEAQSDQFVAVVSWVGRTWPVARSDAGPALLSAMSDTQVRDLLRDPLPDTAAVKAPRTLDELLQLVDEVRRTGVSLLDLQAEEDIASAAAPVIDHRGHPVAALCVSGPADRIRPRMEIVGREVVAAARALSAAVGAPTQLLAIQDGT
jgi:IclR family transcriptional regulator, KDG regulon repressor